MGDVEKVDPPTGSIVGEAPHDRYDEGFAAGVASVRDKYDEVHAAGHEAGVRDAMKLVALEHAEAMEAAEARHAKALEAMSSKHAKALKALKSAKDDAAEVVSEAEVEADTARLVAVQEVLALLDERIDRGHADGRLAIVDARNAIAMHFENE